MILAKILLVGAVIAVIALSVYLLTSQKFSNFLDKLFKGINEETPMDIEGEIVDVKTKNATY